MIRLFYVINEDLIAFEWAGFHIRLYLLITLHWSVRHKRLQRMFGLVFEETVHINITLTL